METSTSFAQIFPCDKWGISHYSEESILTFLYPSEATLALTQWFKVTKGEGETLGVDPEELGGQ